MIDKGMEGVIDFEHLKTKGRSKAFNLLSTCDTISRHTVVVTQFPGHLITSCFSSDLTEHEVFT
jgi:hypothetical protein